LNPEFVAKRKEDKIRAREGFKKKSARRIKFTTLRGGGNEKAKIFHLAEQ
jgi:hypothetical protein